MSARSLRAKLAASAAVLGLLAAGVSSLVFSAFTSTVHNADNTFRAGSVTLRADAPSAALFSMAGLKPGDGQERCVRVAFAATGGLTSSVRMYGRTTGTQAAGGLDRYLGLRVTRGSLAGASPAANGCAGFVADRVLFDDTLAAYPDSFATGVADSEPTWHDGDSAVYRFELSVADDDRAQGLDAAQEFAFEARTS